MSILVGVNDVWHDIKENEMERNGIDADKYFMIYDMLIREVFEALPDIKIIIMEPYVTHGSFTDTVWNEFKYEVGLRAEKARLIAEKYNLKYIPLQRIFDEAYKKYPVNGFWTQEAFIRHMLGMSLLRVNG